MLSESCASTSNFFVTLFSIVTVTVFRSISAVTAELSPHCQRHAVPNGNLVKSATTWKFLCQHLIPCLIECGSHYANEHSHSLQIQRHNICLYRIGLDRNIIQCLTIRLALT